jgi:hypothetical protein
MVSASSPRLLCSSLPRVIFTARRLMLWPLPRPPQASAAASQSAETTPAGIDYNFFGQMRRQSSHQRQAAHVIVGMDYVL